jgi:hypothetical protein
MMPRMLRQRDEIDRALNVLSRSLAMVSNRTLSHDA